MQKTFNKQHELFSCCSRAEIQTIRPPQCSELASLTTYFCGGVLWDHRVSRELWMEDAAVCVSVHGQTIQELPVLLHTITERRVCIRNQLSHRVCVSDAPTGQKRTFLEQRKLDTCRQTLKVSKNT